MEADGDNYACDQGHCGTWAGTSFSTPRWVSFAALVNERSLASGGTTIGFFNMPLYNLAESSAYGNVLHDINVGNNGIIDGYSFNAGPGYDLVTGWGSPNGQGLIDALSPSAGSAFQVTASPAIVAITPGTSVTIAVNVAPITGFAGAVALSISGLPSGVASSFSPALTVGKSTLTLNCGTGVVGGAFFVKIVGTSGSLTAVTNISLTVNAPASRLIITSPMSPVTPVVSNWFKAGSSITVSGTAIGSFNNVVMEWAEGAHPSSGWNTAGMSVSTPSSSGLLNQPIGSWDTTGITKADYYSIRLTAAFSDQTYTATTVVYIEPDLLSSAWPKFLGLARRLGHGSRPIYGCERKSRAGGSGNRYRFGIIPDSAFLGGWVHHLHDCKSRSRYLERVRIRQYRRLERR